MEKQTYLQITGRCNQQCVFCSRSPEMIKDDLTFDYIKDRILEMKDDGVNHLYLTGGEPTLHKDLIEMVIFAKKHLPRVELQSNGQKLSDKKLVAGLKQAGLDGVYIAFHDCDKKTSDQTRGVKTGFKNILAGIKNCLAAGLEIKIIHVIYSKNYKNLPRFITYLKKEFPTIKHLNLGLVAPYGRAAQNEWVVPDYSSLKPWLKKALILCQAWGIQFDISAVVPLCLIEGFEQYAIAPAFMINKLVIVDDAFIDQKKSQKKEMKFQQLASWSKNKAPQCKKCTLNKICPGFYPEYPGIHGTKDFIPSKKPLLEVLKKFPNYIKK